MKDNLQVVNVVGTGQLVGTVNLENLYETADSSVVQYDPSHHQGCYLRFRKDGPLITIYHSGKFIIRAESIDEVYNQREKLLNQLREIGVPQSVKQDSFSINNIVATASLGREIDLSALVTDLKNGNATFLESAGRLEYRLHEYDNTISIFRTGSVTIMGSSTLEEVQNTWTALTEEINSLFDN
jgi:transcription initiation factor TFIID TATA-box-binding protein